ncbi:MAG: NAD(P)H-hydrate epimerase, partial [Anaerolineales bacterium]
MKVSSISQMRALDKQAIEDFGITAELLMENAGHAAYYVLRQEFGICGRRFIVFCGTGNNGGDGCVLARKIHADGGWVKVFILGDPAQFKGAARLNFEIITRLPVEIQQVALTQEFQNEIKSCDLIVDAIFGTGLSRDVGGLYREIIEIINRSEKSVLSIDIPSGVHGNNGKIM